MIARLVGAGLLATAVAAGLATSVRAEAPLCSAATYSASWCEKPCPRWPDPELQGCLYKNNFYCGNGEPYLGEAGICVYENCPLGLMCDHEGATGCSDPRIGPSEVCGDGYDNDADGCAEDGCVVGEGQCACTKACDPSTAGTCGNVATCDARTGKREVCGDGEDNDCDGKIDEECRPPKQPEDGSPPCCGCKGGEDPIMLASRSAVTTPFTDFSVTAVSTLGITRSWTSRDVSFFGGPAGIFGTGWHHGWEGTLTCSGDACTVARGASEGFRFVKAETAASLDGAENWQLYRPGAGDGTMARRHLLARRPNGEWILFQSDGQTLHYATVCDACGAPDAWCVAPEAGGRARLVKVVDPRGNAIHLSYARGAGLVLGLTDDLGHSLELRSASACTDGLARELHYDGFRAVTYDYQGSELVRFVSLELCESESRGG